jgi:hyperosmotically inducible protein
MRAHIAARSIVLLAVVAAVLACTTDPGITTRVKAKLMADETVRSPEIEVQTQDGVVTLTGNIDSREAKDTALRLARETRGVVDVVDMIAVKTASNTGDAPAPGRTLGEHIDDAGITLRVKARLLDDPEVKGSAIDVDTREGVVFLTGSVRNTSERDTAIRIARETQGVRDVQANLAIS